MPSTRTVCTEAFETHVELYSYIRNITYVHIHTKAIHYNVLLILLYTGSASKEALERRESIITVIPGGGVPVLRRESGPADTLPALFAPSLLVPSLSALLVSILSALSVPTLLKSPNDFFR